MLTQEQIKNLKPGDKLALSYPLHFYEYDSENDEVITKNNGVYIYFHTAEVELPSEHGTSLSRRSSVGAETEVPTPKYDPTRLFKKGDKVRYEPKLGRYEPNITKGSICTVLSDERNGRVQIEYCDDESVYTATIPFFFLEVVTPVEELEPYKLIDSPNTYNIVRDSAMVMTIHKKSHPNAKAAAEAERDRLNAEWRKEHGNED